MLKDIGNFLFKLVNKIDILKVRIYNNLKLFNFVIKVRKKISFPETFEWLSYAYGENLVCFGQKI